MKSKNILVPVLSITLILVSLTLVSSFGLSKRPKQNSEWIIFSGDLEGSQEVVGCCPNAGPNPEYTMTLSEVFFDVFPSSEINEPHVGHIFMNVFINRSEHVGGKRKAMYLVKFWWGEGDDDYFYDYFIEVRGGDIESSKKTKSLTVTFDEVPCKIWIDDDAPTATVTVSFTLTREQMYL